MCPKEWRPGVSFIIQMPVLRIPPYHSQRNDSHSTWISFNSVGCFYSGDTVQEWLKRNQNSSSQFILTYHLIARHTVDI